MKCEVDFMRQPSYLVLLFPLFFMITSHIELTWRERAPLPIPRAGYIAGVIGGRYLIAGGSFWEHDQKKRTPRADLYDPRSDTWLEGTPLPESRGDAASAALDDNLSVL